MSKPQAIEVFHLAFLLVLPQHLPPEHYAVKGGANLRLFLGSVRRSEDIDFNFVGRVPWSLKSRIAAALRAPALPAQLNIHGMKIESVNPSKSTATTERWKFQLVAPGVQVSSKVEFSMRPDDQSRYEMAPVAPALAEAARMRPALANHYVPAAATAQKIAALARRTETQARDVFDLDFLFTRYPTESAGARPDERDVDCARQRVFEVTYEEYLDLVVTYIDPSFVAMYRSRDEWDRMALNVATRLDGMRGGDQ